VQSIYESPLIFNRQALTALPCKKHKYLKTNNIYRWADGLMVNVNVFD